MNMTEIMNNEFENIVTIVENTKEKYGLSFIDWYFRIPTGFDVEVHYCPINSSKHFIGKASEDSFKEAIAVAIEDLEKRLEKRFPEEGRKLAALRGTNIQKPEPPVVNFDLHYPRAKTGEYFCEIIAKAIRWVWDKLMFWRR